MSLSTGTRKERNVQTRSNEAIIEADKEYINSLKVFSASSISVAGLAGGAVNNSPKTPAGNYLARTGDSMIGPFALGPPLDFTIEVDANNTIDIGPSNNNPQYTSNVQLDDLQPNSSVLDIIANAAFDGQVLILRTFAPTVAYTISQGTVGNGGNIQTGDSSDLTVGDLQTVVLIFDDALIINANTGGTWRVVSSTTVTGGGGLSEPVILTINTITPQTLPTTSDVDWSKNPNHITIDRDVEFSFSNLPVTGSYEGVLVIIDIDGTGGYATPVWPASVLNPPVVPTTANTRTSVMLYTINNGTVVTHATSVGSSTGGNFANTSLSNLVSPVLNTSLSFGNNDATTIDRIQMSGGTTSATSATDVVWYIDSSGNLVSNTPSSGDWLWSSANVVKMLLTDNVLEKRDAVAPAFQLYNTRAAQTGTAATISLLANSTATATGVPMGFIIADTENIASDGTGSLKLGVRVAGVATNFMTLNDSDDGNVKLLKQLDMNSLKVINLLDGTAAQDAVTKSQLDALGTPNAIVQLDSNVTVTDVGSGVITMTVDGTQRYSIQANRADYATIPVFGITNLTLFDSTSAIGAVLTTNTTSFDISVPVSSDIISITHNSITTAQFTNTFLQLFPDTPNTAFSALRMFRDDPSPTVNDVVGEVHFRGNDTAATQNNIVYGKIGVEIEDATEALSTGSFQWTVRNLGIDQDMMSLKDGVLGISRNSITLAAAQGAAVVIVRDDTGAVIGDEAGELDFNINDGTETVYGNISVTWDNTSVGDDSSRMDFKLLTDDNLQTILTLRGSAVTDNKIAMEVGANSFIKTISGVMGYFVTNDPAITDVIGDNGTIQIPQFNNGSPSLAQLNAAFGAFDGAIGQDINDGKLYVRKNSTTWSFYSESGTVT